MHQNLDTVYISEHVRKVRVQITELSHRKFYIPAARLQSQAVEVVSETLSSLKESDALLADAETVLKLLQADGKALFEAMIEDIQSYLFLKNDSANRIFLSRAIQMIPSCRFCKVVISYLQ